jgi:hypothetical protein
MSDTQSPAESTTDSSQPVEDKPGDSQSVDSGRAAPEYGGPKGREPTRYGDWEKNGRCIDF